MSKKLNRKLRYSKSLIFNSGNSIKLEKNYSSTKCFCNSKLSQLYHEKMIPENTHMKVDFVSETADCLNKKFHKIYSECCF